MYKKSQQSRAAPKDRSFLCKLHVLLSSPNCRMVEKDCTVGMCSRCQNKQLRSDTMDININKRMSHSFSFIQHNHMPQKLVQGKVQHCTYAALVCQMKRGRSKIANFLSFGSSCSSGMHVGEVFTKNFYKISPPSRGNLISNTRRSEKTKY